MFEPTSRYHPIETVSTTSADGRVIAYKRRRFLPPGGALPLLTEITVAEGERLDRMTFRTLGDPEQFWRICDANDAMSPDRLVEVPGRILRVPVPQP